MSSRRKGTPPGVGRDAGARPLAGSPEAKRQASAVLEVLSGLRAPTDASAALGCSLQRYYVLETRAIQGLIVALEPKPRGKRRRPEDEAAALRRDRDRLARELARAQALVRVAQRAVGLAAPQAERAAVAKGDGKRTRRRRPKVRAGQVIATLRKDVTDAAAVAAAMTTAAASPPPTAGDRGEERAREGALASDPCAR